MTEGKKPLFRGGGWLQQPAMVDTVFDKDGIACNVTGLPTEAQQYLDSVVDRAYKAEAAMWHALERLDASLFTNAEHQQAKDILRAALNHTPPESTTEGVGGVPE